MSYVVDIRRKLHEYPEIGFDLPKTLELVRTELTKMGIPFTEKFGESGIVATINEEKSHFTIGIRADMDALPITEKNKVPYKSKIKGQMHACGHDAHTAILLDTARKLSEIKEKINCMIKFIFQPAEEFPPSGAKLMVQDGVMNEIDCIIALHCDPNYKCGEIALLADAQNAISSGFHLNFYGKSAHAAQQEKGIDAIAMAVKAYSAIEFMIAKELPAKTPRVFNVGAFNGGITNNVICDYASLNCTLRTHEEETDAYITKRIKSIISGIAKESGGRAKFLQDKYYPIVYNNETVMEKLRQVAISVVGEKNILLHKRSMGGEDFSYFLHKKPGAMFRLGIRNENTDCIYALHQDKFNIDEKALSIGSDIFARFVKENMNGIDLEDK